MAERKVPIMIFLMAAFAFLSIFIAMWVYGIYVEKSAFAKKTSASSIECTTYSFDIQDAEFKDNSLSFTIENPYGDPFNELVIEAQGSPRIVPLEGFTSGMVLKKKVEDINITGSFLAYPKGCKDANKKRYYI